MLEVVLAPWFGNFLNAEESGLGVMLATLIQLVVFDCC